MSKVSRRDSDFAFYLEHLRDGRNGRAVMASLRRALGRSPGEAPEADRYILPWLPSDPSPWQKREEEAYYVVASLFALHQEGWPRGETAKGLQNLGASMHLLANKVASGGAERRFIALLTCSPEDLPERLRHAVSLLKSNSIPIDWAQLLADVRQWEDDRRGVQGEWARAFWGKGPPEAAGAELAEQSRETDEGA